MNDLLKIINNYDVVPQLEYYQSEVWELYEAIFDYENTYFEPYTDYSIEPERSVSEEEQKKYLKKHIAEEITDNCVMLYQFPLYYYERLDEHNIAPYEFKTDNYEHIEDINEYFKKFMKSIFKLNRAVIIAEERDQDYISEHLYEEVTYAVDEVIYKLVSIKEHYHISTKDLKEIGEYKINRQLKRMKEDK